MKKLDLSDIIKKNKLDADMLSAYLFPNNKHPKLALKRVISGEAELTDIQIQKVARLLQLSMSDLYSESWSIKSELTVYTFKKGDITAFLNRRDFKSTLMFKNKVIHESIIHLDSISLRSYLDDLEYYAYEYENANI